MTIFLFATGAVSQAAVYYVATTGSDSNSGSSSSPWRTIGHAAGVVNAGDTVIVENGTYNELVTFNASGGPGSPITFKSQNKWGAVVAPSGSGLIFNVNASYVTFQDFEIVGNSGGSNNSGIKFQSPGNGGRALGNKIHHIGVTSGCSGGAAIISAQGSAVINANWIYDISAAGCTLEEAIYVNDGNGTKVTNNLVVDTKGTAIQFNGEEAVTTGFPSNIITANNTVVAAGGMGLYMSCYHTWTCQGNNFNNNIFYSVNTGNNLGGSAIYQSTAGTGTFSSNNNILNNLVYLGAPGGVCLHGGGRCIGTLSGTVTSNPLFVNYTGNSTGDYHLQSSSPAVDAGTATGAPSTDFDGNSQTSPPTNGAFVASQGALPPAAPTGLTASVN